MQQRRNVSEEEYIKKRKDYQKRWDMYRVQQAEVAVKKKEIIEHLASGLGYRSMMKI